MKKLTIIGVAAISAAMFAGCETTSNTTKKVNDNTAVVVNNNANMVTNMNSNMNSNVNKEMSRSDFDKDKSTYEANAKSVGSKIGSGADDLWIWSKTRAELLATNDLRESTINVDVDNAMITLRGTVGTAAEKSKAEEVAKSIDGQKGVKNELKVDAKDSMTNQMTTTDKTNMNKSKSDK